MPVALEKLYAQTPRKSDDVEQRLQRLERMVQSLVAERRPKAAQANNPPCNMTSVNSQEMEELKKMTDRKAAEAAQQAKAASEDAKRASKDLERAMKEKNTRAFGMHQESSQLQLDALRQARQDLQREMQRLDAEIRRLEQERRRLEQEQRRLEQETKPAPEHRGRNKPRDGQTSDDETEPETQ
jgi:colicin import membrane protein